MKVCIYAICKNEEIFVERWLASATEADEIYVNDTGSTDKTAELLEANPKVHLIHGKASGKNFRFDYAWNEILACIPQDVDLLVRLDLDQAFTSGWRAVLEEEVSSVLNKSSEKKKKEFCFQFSVPCFESRASKIHIDDSPIGIYYMRLNHITLKRKEDELCYIGAVHEDFICLNKPTCFTNLSPNKILITHTPRAINNTIQKSDLYLNLSIVNFQEAPTYQNFLILMMGMYCCEEPWLFSDRNTLTKKLLKIALAHTKEEDYKMELQRRGMSFSSAVRSYDLEDYMRPFFLFYYVYTLFAEKDTIKAETIKKEKLFNFSEDYSLEKLEKIFKKSFLWHYARWAVKNFLYCNGITKKIFETLDFSDKKFKKLIHILVYEK